MFYHMKQKRVLVLVVAMICTHSPMTLFEQYKNLQVHRDWEWKRTFLMTLNCTTINLITWKGHLPWHLPKLLCQVKLGETSTYSFTSTMWKVNDKLYLSIYPNTWATAQLAHPHILQRNGSDLIFICSGGFWYMRFSCSRSMKWNYDMFPIFYNF